MLTKTIQRLRLVGILEGISYLLLLGIAMPLKYVYKMPEYVRVVGAAHGALFVVFCVCLLLAHTKAKWSVGRSGLIFVASLFPLGTFLLDGKMREYIKEVDGQ
jgi:integral membrane protein